MAAPLLVPLEEYLKTVYEPDDYADGVVLERNGGEYDHSRLQGLIFAVFLALEKTHGIRVVPEQRVRVSATRVRIPDVCVVLGRPGEQVLTRPPFLCIEILSPEDRMSRVMQRIGDFLSFGVPHVWIIDPVARNVYECGPGGLRESPDGMLRTNDPELVLNVNDLFRDLDEASPRPSAQSGFV